MKVQDMIADNYAKCQVTVSVAEFQRKRDLWRIKEERQASQKN